MSFIDFTLEKAEAMLGVRIRPGILFPGLQPIVVPSWLKDSLERGMDLALVSEKARSEFIVAPILLASREISNKVVAIYSGQRLDVDAAQGLVGECDFILAAAEPVPRLRAPLVTILEAKKNDIDAGLGQCVAQMVAARIFNEREGRKLAAIYGCVTTGESWQFLRLEGETVTLDRAHLYIVNVGAILSAIQAIVTQSQLAA
jgi:hypothetical protein